MLVLAWFTSFGWEARGLQSGSYGGTLDRDAGTFVFYFWQLKEAILGREPLFWSDRMFYPMGFDMLLQDWAPVVGLIALPFQPLGPMAAYNLQIPLAFALTAFTTYLLVLHLSRHRGWALLAGLIFAYCEYRVFKAHVHGQPANAHQELIPLYLLLLWRFLEEGRARFAVFAGVTFFGATFTSPYQGVFLLLATPLLWAHHLWLAVRGVRPGGAAGAARRGGLFALAGGGSAALLALPVVAQNGEAVLRGAPALGAAKLPFTDLLAFVQPFVPDQVLFLEETRGVFLGYSVLALLALSVVLRLARRPTGAGVWLVMAALFFVIALGSALTVDNQQLVSLPFFPLLMEIPGIRGARTASRYASMVVLAAAVASALGLAHLERTRLSRWPRWARVTLQLALLGAVGTELIHHRFRAAWPAEHVPLQMNLTGAYRRLAREPGSTTLLTFPPIWETENLKMGPHYFPRDNFVFHTLHKKKTLAGSGDAIPPGTVAYFRDLPLVSQLFWMGEGVQQPEPDAEALRQARYVASFLGVRHVLVQRALLGAEAHPERADTAVAYLRKLFRLREIYRDEWHLLYRVMEPPEGGAADTREIRFSAESSRVHLGSGWLRVDPYGTWIAEGNLRGPGPGDLLFRRSRASAGTVELVYRCTGPPCGGRVELNGRTVGTLRVGWGWQTDRIRLPERAQQPGLNRLRLRVDDARWDWEPHLQIARIRFLPESSQ